MIKILILFAIIGLTTSIGVMLSGEKKKRAAVFGELYEYNEQLLLNLKFGREDMKELAKPFRFVSDVLEGKQVLAGEDGEFIAAYVHNLGATDALSQIDYLNERRHICANTGTKVLQITKNIVRCTYGCSSCSAC